MGRLVPYEWVPNECWFTHMGVSIYFVCKDDSAECGTREYWYGTSENSSDGEGCETTFDVRDLDGLDPGDPIFKYSTQWGGPARAEQDYLRMRIIRGITDGVIPAEYMAGETPDENDGWVRQRIAARAMFACNNCGDSVACWGFSGFPGKPFSRRSSCAEDTIHE